MWSKKMNPVLYSEILQRTKPLAMGKVMSYQVTHEQLITMVKRVIENLGSEGARTHEYMWYAQKLWKMINTYKSEALQKEADFLYLYYRSKGNNDTALRAIAQSLGIKISPIEDIINKLGVEVGVPTALQIIGRGAILTDGTEQTIIEYTGNITMIQGYIDLSNMDEEDAIIIKAYVKVSEDGEYKIYESNTFNGVQEKPALYVMPRLSGYAFKLTIQQTTGSYKSFDYLITKGG